jgi:hypothetical protein
VLIFGAFRAVEEAAGVEAAPHETSSSSSSESDSRYAQAARPHSVTQQLIVMFVCFVMLLSGHSGSESKSGESSDSDGDSDSGGGDGAPKVVTGVEYRSQRFVQRGLRFGL